MIDFNNPAQTTNQGKPIPINTQAKYDRLRAAVKALYDLTPVPWTQTSEDQLERRVLNGGTPLQIVGYTVEEFLERSAD